MLEFDNIKSKYIQAASLTKQIVGCVLSVVQDIEIEEMFAVHNIFDIHCSKSNYGENITCKSWSVYVFDNIRRMEITCSEKD